ncbi:MULTISPECIES: hypothetical protein [Candidatus Cardinium]|uniref:hypothetical protein n=1 Tax=Candidatus Cardinium TaxID=273135 RepID=UPI001FAA4771|nr:MULTISPECIES: hypothetical protein [Cardinium]
MKKYLLILPLVTSCSGLVGFNNMGTAAPTSQVKKRCLDDQNNEGEPSTSQVQLGCLNDDDQNNGEQRSKGNSKKSLDKSIKSNLCNTLGFIGDCLDR